MSARALVTGGSRLAAFASTGLGSLVLVLPPALGLGLDRSAAEPVRLIVDEDEGDAQEPSARINPWLVGAGSHDDEPIASAAAEAALERGLAFLEEQLATSKDGSLPCSSGPFHAPVGVTALGALAFMSAGSVPGRGRWSESLDRCLEYLLARVQPESAAAPGYIVDEADGHSQMHGHGLATLALAQAYGISPRSPRGRRIQEALVAAVERIEASQSLEGGWYYEPRPGNEHEGSITVCVVQALRAARGAGIAVDHAVIAKAVDYVKRLQNDQGGFQYALSQPQTTVALTAACLSTLQAAGVYDSNEIHDGYGYLWRELNLRDEARVRGLMAQEPRFPYYERFYLSQTFWQHPDERVFRGWAPDELRRVIGSQEEDGSWRDLRHDERGRRVEARYGSSYATAMNCLFLALPEGLLPIFQR